MDLAPPLRGDAGSGSLLDRCLAARDRLLASPRFQRWAAGFAPFRPVAKRRSRALFDLCAGFVYSQVLFACVRLRLFEILAEEPQAPAALAARLRLPEEAALRLLKAAAALDLVERRRGGRFGLGTLGAAMLGNPAVAAMVEHHAMLYADLADPVALLRGERGDTELGRYWAYANAERPGDAGRDQVAAYSALMSSSQAFIADEIIEAYPLGRHRCLLDVGGGEGTFLRAVAARVPGLRLVLFDLPAVAERAAERFERDGLTGRADAVGGDFVVGSLPGHADVATLVRVIHDHDDARALAILGSVRRCLPDDGTLLVAEPMAGTAGAEPIGDAYFGFYLMAMGSGRPRTAAELTAMLHEAGFACVREVRTRRPMLTRLLVARPSAT